ncbi:HlyD family secretion protein [bacterium]|nr:HlyD family secretion protein [bacterium]MBU1872314.1 HlyD family secretion protein [bacterium]
MKKFRQTYIFNWYVVLWIVAVAGIFYLYLNWHVNKKYIGIVERRTHLLGAQEPGRINSMFVSIGNEVKKDQVIAILDVSDLKTNLNNLRNELTQIQSLTNAQTEQYSMQIVRLKLQLDNEALELLDRLSLIESKSTELAGLNALIKRLQDAETAGLGYNRDLAPLIIQRDALEAYLREQGTVLPDQTERVRESQQSRKKLEEANLDNITKSMLLERMERAEDLRREIDASEYRIHLRTIITPCDGYVTEILANAGDVVQEFIPCVTIEESKASYLIVYLPEKARLKPEPGMLVKVYSPRNSDFNTTGTVTFIHPGFTMADERLSFRGQFFWARKVHVELDQNHNLIPSEVVYVKINAKHPSKLKNNSAKASKKPLLKTEHQPGNHPPIKNLKVPVSLQQLSRFEPSGVVWLPDLKKYLIVSDDTGIQNTKNDHAPYLFLMDKTGAVDAEPVLLSGTNTINDLEAITAVDDNTYYLLASQNISKNGKRPRNREYLVKMTHDGDQFKVQNRVNFLSLILRSYDTDKLNALGLQHYAVDGHPELNIEAAAYSGDALYIGLKQPVSDKGAIIWKLSNPDSIFQNQPLSPDQLSIYGTVDLGENAGISDLSFDQNGILWALSTIPNASKEKQLGSLHRIRRFADGHLEADRIYDFPNIKPEGLCHQNDGQMLIVFDNDDELPSFCTIDGDLL